MGFFDIFKNRNSKFKDESIYDEEENDTIEYDEFEKVVDMKENISDTTRYNEEKSELIYENIMRDNTKRTIKEEIIKVIDNYNDISNIESILDDAVRNIGKDNLSIIKECFDEGVEISESILGKYETSKELDIVVENSILMIIYNFAEDGVDELLKIATRNQEYRFKSINLLCKLASRNISTDKIVDSIIFIMKSLTEEEVQKVLVFLSQIKNNLKISRLLELYYKKYILEGSFDLAYDTVINIVNIKGKCSSEQLIFLKTLALYEGTLDVRVILGDQEGELEFKNLKDDLRVKAAVSFYALNKEDRDINYRLIYLKENSLEPEIREFLNEVLA